MQQVGSFYAGAGSVNMKTQWQIYKELELIPDSISEQANQSVIKRITQVWHVIFEAKPPVIQSQEQKVEHLERCFDLRADAYELEYTCTYANTDVKYDLHMLQKATIINGKLYVLTFSALNTTYDKYIGKVRKMFDSFKIQ